MTINNKSLVLSALFVHVFVTTMSPVNAFSTTKTFRSLLRRSRPEHTKQHHRTTWPPQVLHVIKSNNLLEGIGMPSNPGWSRGRLDRLTEWAGSNQPNRPVICEYEPSGFWLWFKWRGTVLKMTKVSVWLSMMVGLGVDLFCRRSIATKWSLVQVPPATEPLIQSLVGLDKLWEYQLTLATFILTFFLSQAYNYWQKVYDTCRKIQGRINDLCLLMTLAVQRREEDDDSNSTRYREDGEALVRLCTRLIRMSHSFFWAATPTASSGLTDCEEFLSETSQLPLPVDDEHIGPLLLSPYGLKALVKAGQLTKEESYDLMASNLPPSQYAYILLTWVGLHIMEGFEQKSLRGGPGLEENMLRQLTTLRACMFDIDDFRAGRMPLAYVQLVQVLVDSLVMMAPFALYPEVGSMAIPLVGLLALFFRGLLTLSKSFLDPFGVEGYTDQNIRVDVLVSELNFGAAKRWITAGSKLPGGRFRSNSSAEPTTESSSPLDESNEPIQ